MDRVVVRKRWRRWAPAAIGLGVLLAAVVGYLVLSPMGARAIESDGAEITEVVQADFHDFVPARGSVTPRQSVFLDAVEGGRVDRLLVEDGAVVQAGQLLAVLTNPQLALEVGSREAEISARLGDARGQLLQLQRSRVDRERELAQARFDLLRAEQNLEICSSLHAQGYVSEAEIRTRTAEAEHYRQRVAALEASARPESEMMRGQSAEIRQMQAQLQDNLGSVRGTLSALEVRAPTAGRLTAFELQLGQTVAASQRIGQIDTEGDYKLTADVAENYLGRVSVGQTARAEYEGESYDLRVSRILPQVSEGRFLIELTFQGDAPPSLSRGQSMELELTLGATQPALVIPNGPFMQDTGGTWIFVVSADGGRAERRAIRTGRRNPQFIEVLDGLRPGERVLTSSYDGLAEETRLILR